MYAVIGGSGFDRPDFVDDVVKSHEINTVYGRPSAVINEAEISGKKVFFLARHGGNHTIAPHKINYRANIKALASLGVTKIIAVAAVGSINPGIPPQSIIIPDQIIDYTYGREHTFFDKDKVEHIEFGKPYSRDLGKRLINSAHKGNIKIITGGVYGVTQGPRLETDAEIGKMARDGCDLVGMTAMPEASLAREAGLEYATIAVAANYAAGITDKPVSMEEINNNLKHGIKNVHAILIGFFALA